MGNFAAPLWVSWVIDGHFLLINEDIPGGAVGVINEYNRFVYSYSNNWIVYLFQWKFQGPKINPRPYLLGIFSERHESWANVW